MPRLLSCLFITGVLFTSCKKDSPHNNTDPNNALVGNWRWTLQLDAKAVNGLPYDSLTPTNTGRTEFLHINADSSWSLVRNGHTLQSGRYKFPSLLSPEGPINSLDLVHDGTDSLINHSISHDTLYTSNVEYSGTYTVRIYVK